MRLLLVVALVAVLDARTLVHTSEHDTASSATHHVKETQTKYHVNADLVDVTQSVMELPEQTISTKSPPAGNDLEEDDEQDVTHLFQELPEQTIESPQHTSPSKPVVANPNHIRDLEPETEEEEEDDQAQVVDSERSDHKQPPLAHFRSVSSELPSTDEQITASDIWGNPTDFLTAKVAEDFHNPLLKNRDHDPRWAAPADKKAKYDSAEHQQEGIDFTSGGYQIKIHQNHAKNFLDARRVQVGTSLLGAHQDPTAKVARFRVRFFSPFAKRPIVLVTTVPEGAEKQDDRGPHPDVFAASVSEIRLDHFVVSVVRIDSFPQNTWGQSLYLDWIALEYQSDYPIATYGGSYLMTHPAFQDRDLEHSSTPPQDDTQQKLSWDE